jgi:DNA polymerase
VCDALQTYPKDEDGGIAMKQVTKPRKPSKDNPDTRWTPENAPDKFIDTYVYNVEDVLAECGADEVMPELSPYEQNIYYLDQHINERGVAADIEAIHNAKSLIDEYKAFLEIAHEKATRPVLPTGCPQQRRLASRREAPAR